MHLRLSRHADACPRFCARTCPYSQRQRHRRATPLPGGSAPPREPVTVDGSLPGRAFTRVEPCASFSDTGGGARLWLPLLNGAERMGVLEVVSDAVLGEQAVQDCVTLASLLTKLVVTRGMYGDLIERVRRREPMQMAAEILRAQLPPLTFSTGHLIISGVLEPCYDVGGDAFDYAVNGDIAHFALFDAVGHGSAGGMRSVVLASLALASYRNARRRGLDLIATYGHINTAVHAHDRGGMITAVLAELDQRTGILQVMSAGHPGGIVLRDGKVVKVLPAPTALPVPLGDKRAPVIVEEALEPGDRVLLYTDGIIEARSAEGQQFGLDRLIDFAVKADADGLPPPDTTRRLVHAILDYQDDRLQDDATVLLAEWLSPAPPRSDTELPTPPADDLLALR